MIGWPIFVLIELGLNMLALPICFKLGRITHKIGGPWQFLWAWMFFALLIRFIFRLVEFQFGLSGEATFFRGVPSAVYLLLLDIVCLLQLRYVKRFLATPGVLEQTADNTALAFSSSVDRLKAAADKLERAIKEEDAER